MEAVSRGDLSSLTPLFERHARRLFGFLRGLVGSPSSAEDLVQETFLKILRHRRSFRPGSAFLPWFLGIARNAAWAFLDRRSRMPSGALEERVDADSPEPLHLARERAAGVTHALRQLPAVEREVLLLSYFEGLRHREIAELLGSTPGAVKVRIHRARKAARQHLAEWEKPA